MIEAKGVTLNMTESAYAKLRALQACELDILLEIDRICREEGLTYFLDSGTALGAVRHQGFIPWDDDIDIAMLRKDYDRFMAIAPSKLKKPYLIQSTYTESASPFMFGKVKNGDTQFIEWNKRKLKINHGVFVDIFPLDDCSSDNALAEANRKEYDKYLNLFLLKKIPAVTKTTTQTLKGKCKAVLRYLLHLGCKLIPDSFLVPKMEALEAKSRTMGNDYVMCLSYTMPNHHAKAELLPAREICFEGHSFMTYNNVELYLKRIYGDYMALPAPETRTGHLPYHVDLAYKQTNS